MGRVDKIEPSSSKHAEFAITVAPDCMGTPHENTNRTWFYFGVSLRDPVDPLAQCGGPAASLPSTPGHVPPLVPELLAPIRDDAPTLPRLPLPAASSGPYPAASLLRAAPADALSRLQAERGPRGRRRRAPDRDDASTSAEGESDDEADCLASASSSAPVGEDAAPRAAQPEAMQQDPSSGSPSRHSSGDRVAWGETKTIRLSVCDMNNQGKLYRQGYRPWCRVVPGGQWRRMPNTPEMDFSYTWGGDKTEGGTGLVISWKHRLKNDGTTTYFAFCAPFGYDDWQSVIGPLESGLAARQAAAAGGTCPPGNPLQILSDAIQDGWVPRVGSGIYFHRQELSRSLEGRSVDLLTLTNASEQQLSGATQEEMPPELNMPGSPPVCFPGKPIVFFSARVHPGETPGQFAWLGALRHLLSDDPRAVALRDRFVFKLVPILNPDGVARGHYRTNTKGLNLNRFYDKPVWEDHEAVWSTKQILMHWSQNGRLLLYVDFHAHANRAGCFFLANRIKGPAQAWNTAYAKLCHVNSPHFDLVGSEFSDLDAAEKECKDGFDKRGSGRVAVFADCRVCHAYTLECNYNKSRNSNTVYVHAPHGLPAWTSQPGLFVKGEVAYDQGSWAQIGECLCVSLLDLYGHNCWSRLPTSKYNSASRCVGAAKMLHARSLGPAALAAAAKPHVEVPLLPCQTTHGLQDRESGCRGQCCWKQREAPHEASGGVFGSACNGGSFTAGRGSGGATPSWRSAARTSSKGAGGGSAGGASQRSHSGAWMVAKASGASASSSQGASTPPSLRCAGSSLVAAAQPLSAKSAGACDPSAPFVGPIADGASADSATGRSGSKKAPGEASTSRPGSFSAPAAFSAAPRVAPTGARAPSAGNPVKAVSSAAGSRVQRKGSTGAPRRSGATKRTTHKSPKTGSRSHRGSGGGGGRGGAGAGGSVGAA